MKLNKWDKGTGYLSHLGGTNNLSPLSFPFVFLSLWKKTLFPCSALALTCPNEYILAKMEKVFNDKTYTME